MKTTKSKSILTRKQAAELLSVSLTTLKSWSDKKLIKAYKLGGRVYYKEKELLKALELSP
ncbi:MAG: excisionase [Fluviicola sp.]|nr:MAG: excisionase [Fluviicola sp.]